MLEQEALKILGLKKGASQDDIIKAGRAERKKYHPDLQKNNAIAETEEAAKKYAKVEEAIKTLGTGKEIFTTLEDVTKGGLKFKMGGHPSFAKTRERKEEKLQEPEEINKNDEIQEPTIEETTVITEKHKNDPTPNTGWSVWDLPIINYFSGNSPTNTEEV